MHNKTLQELTIHELASVHLHPYYHPISIADGLIWSGLGPLVTEIQQSRSMVVTGFFSPLYGAFALLDQIGNVYSNTARRDPINERASGIKKALYYFGNMAFDSNEMKALYCLRNSLVHDGSLLYRGRYDQKQSQWKGPFYRFSHNKELTSPVKLPTVAWDGNLENISRATTTEINTREISMLSIEAVYSARSCLEDGTISINLNEGEIELFYRYLNHKPC